MEDLFYKLIGFFLAVGVLIGAAVIAFIWLGTWLLSLL